MPTEKEIKEFQREVKERAEKIRAQREKNYAESHRRKDETIREALRKQKEEKMEIESRGLLEKAKYTALRKLGKTAEDITYEYFPTFQEKVLEEYAEERRKYNAQHRTQVPNISTYRFDPEEVNEANRNLARKIKHNIYTSARQDFPTLPDNIPNTHSLLRRNINTQVKNAFNAQAPSKYEKAHQRWVEEKETAKAALEQEEAAQIQQQAQEQLEARIRKIAGLQAELLELGINLTEDDNDLGIPFDMFLETRLAQEKRKGTAPKPANTSAERIARLQAKLRALGKNIPENTRSEENRAMGLSFEEYLEAQLVSAEREAAAAAAAPQAAFVPPVGVPNGLRYRGPKKPAEKPKAPEQMRENLLGNQAQAQAVEQRENRRNAAVDRTFLEMQRHNAFMEGLALGQAEAQQLNREAAMARARNQERLGERAVREAAAAREGVVNVREGQMRQNAQLFSIRGTGEAIMENTRHIINVTNETLQISKRIDSGVDEIKRLQRLMASDKKGFIKAILDNELVMAAVFFILHTNFPWTASSLQGIYYNIRLLQRSSQTIKRLVQGQINFSIGGILGEISPLAFSYFMIYYNNLLVEYRVSREPGYVEAFGTTMEDYVFAFGRAPAEYYRKYTESGGSLPIPSKEQILAFLNDKALAPLLAAFQDIGQHWAEPSTMANVIREYLKGTLVIVVNGVTHIIGMKQAWYQFKTLNYALMYVLSQLFSDFMRLIGRNLWYAVAAGLCWVSDKFSAFSRFSPFPNYQSCMASLYGKEHMEGGANPSGNGMNNKNALPDLSPIQDEIMKLYMYSPSQFDYYIEYARYEYITTNFLFLYSRAQGTALGKEYNKIVNAQLELGANLYEFQMYPSLGFMPYEDAFYWKPKISGYLNTNRIFLLENSKEDYKKTIGKMDGGRRKTKRFRMRGKHTRKIRS